MVIFGVLMFFEASSNYWRRGTPSVTFLSETPAKWKVFKVIWVVGYPIDCAAIAPIASPGTEEAWIYFDLISSTKPIN